MHKRGFVIISIIYLILMSQPALAPSEGFSVFDKIEVTKDSPEQSQKSVAASNVNRKSSKYYPKDQRIAFMVSDLNWSTVLPWNSATVWSKPDVEEPKDEHIGLKPILSWDPKFHQFDLYPFGQEFTVDEPITVDTISIYYTEPAFFTNTVTLEIVAMGKEDDPLVFTSFEGKGNPSRSPAQWKTINLLQKFEPLKKGKYKLRAYTDGGDWPEWGFKHIGTVDKEGNPSADYEERGILYRLVGNQLIENVIEEYEKIDIGPCNELVFDNDKVYPKPVNVCAHPLAFYHEETTITEAGTRLVKRVEGGRAPFPELSGDSVIFTQRDTTTTPLGDQLMHIDLSTGHTEELPINGEEIYFVSASNGKVLWQEKGKNGKWGFVIYNLKTGQKEELNLNTDLDALLYAETVGDFVFWEKEDSNGLREPIIYIQSLVDNKQETIIYPQNMEVDRIHGNNNKLFWVEEPKGGTAQKSIHMFDLITKQKTLLLDNANDWSFGKVSEDFIVKDDLVQGIRSVHVYDIKTKTSKKIFIDDSIPYTFNIDKGKIVWDAQKGNGYNIYVYDPSKSGEKIERSFDADASIYLLQQYQPFDKLYAIGSLPDRLSEVLDSPPPLGADVAGKVTVLDPVDDYLKLWEYYGTVVYVEHDYDLALVAASYASLLNAPLIIERSQLDTEDTFRGRKVICVGNVNPKGATCSETYDLFTLQKKYIETTDTNRFILINPDDWTTKQKEAYKPDKSHGDIISDLYTKASLTSTRLAGLKEEALIITHETTMEEVDQDFTQTIHRLRPDLRLGDTQCRADDDCATGFREITKTFKNYGNKITYTFDYPDGDIPLKDISNIEFQMIVTDCDGWVDVEFYNNDVKVTESSAECEKDPFIRSFAGYKSVSDYQLLFRSGGNKGPLQKGDLTIKLKEPGTILIGEKKRDDVKIEFKESLQKEPWSCDDCVLEKKSDKKVDRKITKTATDKREVSFTFSDLNPANDYILNFEIAGDLHPFNLKLNSEVYVNGNKVSRESDDKKDIPIPRHLVTNPMTVKVKFDEETKGVYTLNAILLGTFKEPTFLTIISSPNTIPISKRTNECDIPDYKDRAQEVDNRFYGDV
ncbi:hypothetical protein CL622_02650, partial [archaeon]|nr:hypothetical protein [archaeon]